MTCHGDPQWRIQDFPDGGGGWRQVIIWAFFPRKLHEIENICTEDPLRSATDPSCAIDSNVTSLWSKISMRHLR